MRKLGPMYASNGVLVQSVLNQLYHSGVVVYILCWMCECCEQVQTRVAVFNAFAPKSCGRATGGTNDPKKVVLRSTL